MKCRLIESEITGTGERKNLRYNLKLLIEAETPPEGMSLGFTALNLRRQNIWCVIHAEKGMLEVEFWGKEESDE